MSGRAATAPSAPASEPGAQTDVYQPADHTVDEVKDYVTDHPDERQAVLDAEVAGKNRVTLVDWFEAG